MLSKKWTSMRIAPISTALLAVLLLGGCFLPPGTAPKALPLETRADGATRLTAPPAGASDQNPAFSPDGTRIVFTRFANGYNLGPAGLFLLNLNNGQTTRLTPVEDQDNVNLPGSAWNGVNDRIVFASDRQDANELWRIAPEGSDFGCITTHAGLPWYIELSWSPDGQWIVFEARQPGGSEDGTVGQIWRVRNDGTDLTQLTGTSSLDDRQPNWSPVGDRILFQRRALPDGQWDIYTMAVDGSDLHNVTDDPTASDTDASWSPDGQCIVYSTDHGGQSVPHISVIPARGGQPVRVTFSETHKDSAPSWSLDGKWIAFESHQGPSEDSPSALWRIAAPGPACGDGLVDFVLPVVLKSWAAPAMPGLAAVNDFLYQLQNLDLAAIGHSAYDLVVMDYSADGSQEGEFTAAQIAALKHSPGVEKILLAYLSIGEAEDYRFYWQDWWQPGNPSWLDEENPDWPGNYKVRYWDPGWQAIIFSYTDRLLDAGFDGAYLDIIDACEYYLDHGCATAAQEMADLVAAIRIHARARDPDFYIFPQNAPELGILVSAYLNSIDGIGQEDVYYGYHTDDEMTPLTVTAELEGYLDIFKSAGKLVLTTDYATTPAHVDDAYAKSQAKGYVPFVTGRELDRLTINPGHEPD